ncbi:hypothetical protein N2152v2_006758 [Parachlorella kessleri]
MNMSVTTGSIAAALLGVAGHAHKHWGSDFTSRAITVRVLALVMLLISVFMAVYAAVNFKRRGDMLLQKLDGPYDNRVLPVILTVVLMTFLSIVFVGSIASYEQ